VAFSWNPKTKRSSNSLTLTSLHFAFSNSQDVISFGSLAFVVSLSATVSSHGKITSPTPRDPGDASLAARGKAVTNNIKGDLTSHVEGLPEAAKTDLTYKAADYNLWLCRELQFADNKANVRTYTAGHAVHFDVKIVVRHTGTANMSIVDMKSNKIVKQLLQWDQYADEKQKTLPATNTAFDVTIPSDLKGACATAGDCVYHFPFRKMTR
jgi:hypothetical protein